MPSKWKPRDPSIFPKLFPDSVEEAFKTSRPFLLATRSSHSEAKAYLNTFREWRFCLRERGTFLHRCFTIERDHRICTSIVQDKFGYQLWVQIKPDHKNGTLPLDLNPHLKEYLNDI